MFITEIQHTFGHAAHEEKEDCLSSFNLETHLKSLVMSKEEGIVQLSSTIMWLYYATSSIIQKQYVKHSNLLFMHC